MEKPHRKLKTSVRGTEENLQGYDIMTLKGNECVLNFFSFLFFQQLLQSFNFTEKMAIISALYLSPDAYFLSIRSCTH